MFWLSTHIWELLACGLAVAIAVTVSGQTETDEPNQSDATREMSLLEGTWEGYAVEGRGETPDRGPVHLRLVIKGNAISATDLGGAENGKDMGNGTFKLDPSKPLKEIDAHGVLLPGKRERTFLGIYELDGNTLRWCVNNRASERPTEFRTVSGKYLLILKRQ